MTKDEGRKNLMLAPERRHKDRAWLMGTFNMNSERIRQTIRENAAEIVKLYKRIHETSGQPNEWKEACAEFHARYDALAFPGGLNGANERILTGDLEAMEAAVCFAEVRPYFFRSGYMFVDILRKLKRAPLDSEQRARFDLVMDRYAQWRKEKSTTPGN